MKKIISIVLLVFIMGCSDSDSAQNGDIGQGGSLAVFAIKGNYLYLIRPLQKLMAERLY